MADWSFLDWRNRQLKTVAPQDSTIPDDAADYNPIVFNDDRVYVMTHLNLVEFNEVLSALSKGATLNHPEDFQRVIWYFLRWFEMPLSLCELIADCINDPNSPANSAVRNVAGSNGYPTNTPLPTDKQNADSLNSATYNPSCNLDVLWGQCLYIVQSTNRLIVDFLEIFEAYTNPIEVATSLASLPLLDESGVDAIASYAAYIQSVLAENYNAAYTSAVENEITCRLFCAAKDTCTLSIAQISQIFKDEFGTALDGISIYDELLQALAGIPVEGDLVVYGMFAAVWEGLRVANIVLNEAGDKFLELAVALGADNPSNDWELLCTECGTPAGIYYDFRDSAHGFTISSPPTPTRGEYAAGIGFRTTTNAAGSTAVLFARTMTQNATISKVKLEYSNTVSPQPNPLSRVLRSGTVQGTIRSISFPVGLSVAELTITIGITSGQTVGFDLNVDDVAPNTGGTGVITRAWIYFSSAIPDVANWGGELFYE